jgi:hypothetical protein
MNQGTNWVLLMKKNRIKKSRASVPLSTACIRRWVSNVALHRGVPPVSLTLGDAGIATFLLCMVVTTGRMITVWFMQCK